MRSAFTVFLLSFSLARSFAAPDIAAGDALLDKVIRRPGQFDQMCDPSPPLSTQVPLPLFTYLLYRQLHVTPEDLASLKARRPNVIASLKARLAALDLSKAAPPVPEMKFTDSSTDDHPEIGESGVHPRELSALLFEIIVGLDAVETLPELLAVEDQLRKLLAFADDHPKTAPPPVRLDADFLVKRGVGPLSKRDRQIERGRILQRELLSVMLQLLRRQRYEPLLHSSYEKAYETVVRERAKKEDLRDYKTPEDAKAKGQNWVKFDPIVHVPVGYFIDPPTVPFTPKVREEVRGMAQQFLKDVPPEKWRQNDDP